MSGDTKAAGSESGQPFDHDLLAELYEATLRPDSWVRIMSLVARLLRAPMALYNRVDRTFPRESVTEGIGLAPDIMALIRDRDLEQDHIWRAALRLETGSVYRSTEMASTDVLHDGPLYHTIAVPAGVDYVLGANIENSPEFFSNLCVMQGARDFTDGQKHFLKLLVPHLQTASRIYRRIALGDAGRQQALLSFDRARQAVVVLDRSGYALYVNGMARKVLAQADGLELKFGRFVFRSVSAQAEFERLIRLAATGLNVDIALAPQRVRVPRRGPGSPYALSVIPCFNSSDRAVLPDGAGSMVLIYDVDIESDLPIDRLTWLYRLTAAEARVCASLFRSGSVDAVADDLSLTRNTVRSHLKAIYAKFGVVSQGQLMQRLANSIRLEEGPRQEGAEGA